MKNLKKILAAVLVAGAATFAFAAPANADSVHVSLNLGNSGGYYRPAPVVRPAPVRQVYRPVYRPAPRVVYVQPRWQNWNHGRNHGHFENRGRMAYGYGRGW